MRIPGSGSGEFDPEDGWDLGQGPRAKRNWQYTDPIVTDAFDGAPYDVTSPLTYRSQKPYDSIIIETTPIGGTRPVLPIRPYSRGPSSSSPSHGQEPAAAPRRRRWLRRSFVALVCAAVVLPWTGALALRVLGTRATIHVTSWISGAKAPTSHADLSEANQLLVVRLLADKAVAADGAPFDGGLRAWAARSLTSAARPNRVPSGVSHYERRILGRTLSDRSALEVYVNTVSFGHGVRGVCDASYYFFGRPPSRLDATQVAALAAVAADPRAFTRGAATGIRRVHGKPLTKTQLQAISDRGTRILGSSEGAAAWLAEKRPKTCSKSAAEQAALIASAR